MDTFCSTLGMVHDPSRLISYRDADPLSELRVKTTALPSLRAFFLHRILVTGTFLDGLDAHGHFEID